MRHNKKERYIRLFIQVYYNNDNEFRRELEKDLKFTQFVWSMFTKTLYKNGEITQKEYYSWDFPWGKE